MGQRHMDKHSLVDLVMGLGHGRLCGRELQHRIKGSSMTNSALLQGLVRKDIDSRYHEFLGDVFGETKLAPEFLNWAAIIFEAGYLANPGNLKPKHLRFIMPPEESIQ